MAKIITLPFVIVATVAVFALMGHGLDLLFKTQRLWMMIGFMVGVVDALAYSFYLIYQYVKKTNTPN